MSSRYYYREVRKDEVDRQTAVVGDLAVEVVSLDRGLKEPELIFVLEDRRGEHISNDYLGGFTYMEPAKNCIYVALDQDLDYIARTVIHEIEHRFQLAQGQHRNLEEGAQLRVYETWPISARSFVDVMCALAEIGARAALRQAKIEEAESYLRLLEAAKQWDSAGTIGAAIRRLKQSHNRIVAGPRRDSAQDVWNHYYADKKPEWRIT